MKWPRDLSISYHMPLSSQCASKEAKNVETAQWFLSALAQVKHITFVHFSLARTGHMASLVSKGMEKCSMPISIPKREESDRDEHE